MKREACPVLLLAVGLAACGESNATSKPPETPTTDSPAATKNDEPATSARSGGKLDGPAAPAGSEDGKQGIGALKAGDATSARTAFEAATKKNPKQADAFHYLALVDDQAGQKGEAEKNYRKALELDPGLEESAINLAAILIEGGKFD